MLGGIAKHQKRLVQRLPHLVPRGLFLISRFANRLFRSLQITLWCVAEFDCCVPFGGVLGLSLESQFTRALVLASRPYINCGFPAPNPAASAQTNSPSEFTLITAYWLGVAPRAGHCPSTRGCTIIEVSKWQ